jgi:hypothetical protein
MRTFDYRKVRRRSGAGATMAKGMAAFLFVLICAAAVFSQNPDAQTKEKIAVYVTGNAGADEKKALGTKILVELINSGRYRAVERSDDFIKELDREQSKQMSGAVDDNQITTLGKQFGVQVICVADLTPAFGSYQISARLIGVESAEIIAIAEVTNSLQSIDELTQASKEVVSVMLGEKHKKSKSRPAAKTNKNGGAATPNPAASYSAPNAASYTDAGFTGMQRFKTWGLNYLIPGLGSFTVMKDNIGGFTQLGLAVAGYALLFNGLESVEETTPYFDGYYSGYRYEQRIELNAAWWLGIGVVLGNGAFNIYRSVTYRKPAGRATADGDDGFFFAVLPDSRDGFNAVITYNKSF